MIGKGAKEGIVDGREVGRGRADEEGLGETDSVGATLNGIVDDEIDPKVGSILDNTKHNNATALFIFIIVNVFIGSMLPRLTVRKPRCFIIIILEGFIAPLFQ